MDNGSVAAQQELISRVIDKGICVACGACVGLCPYFMYFDGKVAVMDRCTVGQGRCLQICPRAGFGLTSPSPKETSEKEKDPLGGFIRIVKARARESVSDAQYGGVVTALLCHGFQEGLFEAAVLTDKGGEFSPAGRLALSASDAISCAGSRYSASGSLSSLNKAIKEGREKIAVVGLPCQMEAVERMRRSTRDGAQMESRVTLRIGLFCTWALEYRRLKEFLEMNGIYGQVKRYDIPPPPAERFVVIVGDKAHEFPLAVIRGLVYKGCALCPDLSAVWADISVGTLEGDESWNTVIVRTKRGEVIFEEALKNGILEKGDLPEPNLRHLTEASLNKRQRGLKAQAQLVGGQDERAV